MKYIVWAIFAVCLLAALAARVKMIKKGNFCGGSCSDCQGCCGEKIKSNDELKKRG